MLNRFQSYFMYTKLPRELLDLPEPSIEASRETDYIWMTKRQLSSASGQGLGGHAI
jgi:hypothetical protein